MKNISTLIYKLRLGFMLPVVLFLCLLSYRLEATIIVGSANGFIPVVVNAGDAPFDLNVDGDLTPELTFFVATGSPTVPTPIDDNVTVTGGPSVMLFSNGAGGNLRSTPVLAFDAGDNISNSSTPAIPIPTVNPARFFLAGGDNLPTTNSFLGNNNYLGLTTTSGFNAWVDINIDSTVAEAWTLTINDFAYENDSGVSIAAGNIPEPSSYTLGLSLVSLSLIFLRRRCKS